MSVDTLRELGMVSRQAIGLEAGGVGDSVVVPSVEGAGEGCVDGGDHLLRHY